MKNEGEALTDKREFSYRASPEQMALSLEDSPAFTEHALHGLIAELTGRPIRIKLTDNSTSMLSVREHGSHIAVRLHRMFLNAGHRVIKELAGYIKTRKGETPLFWEFINSNQHRIAPPAPRAVSLDTDGKHYDLKDIFKRLNAEYFKGRLSCSITWGARRKGRARVRTLGSFAASGDLIRINPVLDARRVPGYYVEFVVYHEMLHAALFMEAREAGEDNGGGQKKRRRRIHPPEFKCREKEFKDYGRAIKWEGR